jgi:hypothetical protein
MKLTIRGKVWRVIIKDDLLDSFDNPCDGLCEGSTRTIYIDSRADYKVTFLHEFFHAVLDEYGFSVVEIPGPVEEFLVQTLAVELHESFIVRKRR